MSITGPYSSLRLETTNPHSTGLRQQLISHISVIVRSNGPLLVPHKLRVWQYAALLPFVLLVACASHRGQGLCWVVLRHWGGERQTSHRDTEDTASVSVCEVISPLRAVNYKERSRTSVT